MESPLRLLLDKETFLNIAVLFKGFLKKTQKIQEKETVEKRLARLAKKLCQVTKSRLTQFKGL